jgi:hypothetical protein
MVGSEDQNSENQYKRAEPSRLVEPGRVGPVGSQEPSEPSRLVQPGRRIGPVGVQEPSEPSRWVGPGRIVGPVDLRGTQGTASSRQKLLKMIPVNYQFC